MPEPIETIIIRAQQNFKIDGGLNFFKIEIDDDRVLNMLKKYKNVIYRLTPLVMLFPASIKNNTKEKFITGRELNNTKKTLINSKIYALLGIIDLKRINTWDEIKGESLWINATLEEQKEINNCKNLCFSFTTKTLNDLLSFSINLLNDNNKQTTFAKNLKEITILNFKIDVFLR